MDRRDGKSNMTLEFVRDLLQLSAALPRAEVAKGFHGRVTEVSKVQTTTHTGLDEGGL